MMKAKHLMAILLIITLPSIAQVPGVAWVNKVVGGDSKSLGIDPSGNVYTLGNTGPGTFVDVDPGPGSTILYGDSGVIIIYKFNAGGQFVWAKQLPTNVTAECIRADAAQNVYVIGHFSLIKDFDPGPAVFNLEGQGQNDVFILSWTSTAILFGQKALVALAPILGCPLQLVIMAMYILLVTLMAPATLIPGQAP